MILLTGATGFVGSHIHRLLKQRSSEPLLALGRRPKPGITVCDLLDPSTLSSLPWDQISGVIHCAAVIPSHGSFDPFHNLRMTHNLLQQLNPGRLRSLVLISSVAVYPLPASCHKLRLEEDSALFPTDDYGRSKLAQEWLVENFGKDRFPVAILRPSSIYGSGNTSATLLPIFVERARGGLPLVLKGSRSYVQNFVHVDDVATAALQALQDEVSGSYNCFSHETLTTLQLAERIIRHSGSSSSIEDQRDNSSYPRISFNNLRLLTLLGREPLSLEQGLDRS